MSCRLLLTIALCFTIIATLAIAHFAGTASAHVGAVVSRASFSASPPPMAAPPSGQGLVLLPYTWATADQSYAFAWTTNNQTDPTGHFSFYYLDHQVPSQESLAVALASAQPMVDADRGGPAEMWISCTCVDMPLVQCPDAGSRAGDCGLLAMNWNTSAVPAGAYWIVAYNNDPPYQLYSTATAPVLVAHGGASPPPSVDFVLPDGIGAYDQTFLAEWVATGAPPLHYDLYYGVNDPDHVDDPVQLVGKDIAVTIGADGSVRYTWDVSQLASVQYFLQLHVTDATGQSSWADSQPVIQVLHPVDMAAVDLAQAPDLSMAHHAGKSGGCRFGGRASDSASTVLVFVVLLFLRRRSWA